MVEHLLTRDRIAKQLEIEAIAKYIKNGMTVLDVGCGDGETLISLCQKDIWALGLDISVEMIELAWGREKRRNVNHSLWGKSLVMFRQGSILDVINNEALWDIMGGDCPAFAARLYRDPFQLGAYDLVYTQRCIINLPDWEAQKRAIANIAKCLKPGGLYVMLENSWDGLQQINDWREALGLYRIEPPAWNRYLRDDEVEDFANENDCGLRLETIDDYSGTYYFLSRVVNAALVHDVGVEPDYDSPINKLALRLPNIGLRGQGRIWLWRKM